jgi:hypothetical protein
MNYGNIYLGTAGKCMSVNKIAGIWIGFRWKPTYNPKGRQFFVHSNKSKGVKTYCKRVLK